MNTFKPGDTVRRRTSADDHLGTYAGQEYTVDRHDKHEAATYASVNGDLYVTGNPYAHSAAAFELVAPAPKWPTFAPGLYRDVDGRGWLYDVASNWYLIPGGGGPADPVPVDDVDDGWWDVDSSSNTTAMFFDYAERFGLEVRVQVRRAAR